jgi:hypothetical protein
MWLVVSTPAFSVLDPRVRLARVYASEGDRLARGQTLLDLDVDLSGGMVRDCPPISTCRIVLREEACLRSLRVRPGDEVAPGDALAFLSGEPNSPQDEPAREARVTVATILSHADWWAGA